MISKQKILSHLEFIFTNSAITLNIFSVFFCSYLGDVLLTVKCFLGGLGTNPNIPFFGSKPTKSMEENNMAFIKNNVGYEWKIRKNSEV